MRVSIILAAHNEGPALAQTIRACTETIDALDYEIVIADDASTDGAPDDVAAGFPQVRVHRHEKRLGASPAKALGARQAQGDVLVFLDAHTKPEHGAIEQLVQDVEDVDGTAIVTPALPTLDVHTWTNDCSSIGNGYAFDLLTFNCWWVPLSEMQQVADGRRPLYESPALIGCALAISRQLYTRLWGFDAGMRFWGVEDLDLGLKCWTQGHRILHDPAVLVGHRFRDEFDNYDVPLDHVVANQIRAAYKHLGFSVWSQWLGHARMRHSGDLPGHPEGLWARAWKLFRDHQESADEERRALHAGRQRDELAFAGRFGLEWPSLAGATPLSAGAGISPSVGPSARPSVGPSQPPCNLTGVTPATATVVVGVEQTFNAQGTGLSAVRWSAPGGTPASGTGATFNTRWSAPGARQVTAGCGGVSRIANVTVVAATVEIEVPSPVVRLLQAQTLRATVKPPSPATNFRFEIKRVASASWTELASNPSDTFLYNPRVAGHFDVRVTATVGGGAQVVSPPKKLEVQFPAFADVVADADVQTFTDASWQSTLAAATPTTRREEGFWIQFDTTAIGRFTHTTKVLGPVVGPTQSGSVVLGARPADSPANPTDLLKGAVYSVASFHTHTPTTFRPVGRPVGPSAADNSADTNDDVTGVVYDYVEDPAGTGSIPAGHPLNSAAQRYHSGPTRRTTPP